MPDQNISYKEINRRKLEEWNSLTPQQQIEAHLRYQRNEWIRYGLKQILPFVIIAGILIRDLFTDHLVMRYNPATESYSVDPVMCVLMVPALGLVWMFISIIPDMF